MATSSMDALTWFRKQVEAADVDLLREMITSFAGALMGAEVDALCSAGYGERTPERVNSRNGYRERTWDTRVGTIELAIPKLPRRQLLPGLAARAAPAFGASPGGGGRRVLPARCLHPPGRGAGPDPGHRAAEQVPGEHHGQGAGPDGGELPQPPPRSRRLPLCVGQHPHPAGARTAGSSTSAPWWPPE